MRQPVTTYTSGNKVSLIKGGKPYFDALLQLISEARWIIHVQVYIFGDDETGHRIAHALKEAVQRKVIVYLLVDGYASQHLSKTFIHDLEQAGISFRFFEPLFRSKHFYFGRRMHHKVVVADARRALVGGINIADRYNDVQGIPAWLDFAVDVQGTIAKELHMLCWKTWNGFLAKKDKGLYLNQPPPEIPEPERTAIRMRRNDWVRNKLQVSSSYIELLKQSRHDVVILCSYFLPGKLIRRQIRKALMRGVRIRVIAAGVSDVVLAKEAERWLYDWMLRNGVQLYEYQKTVLHGKLAVCDDRWMTIGSYNVNDISAYASIELNLDIRNDDFTRNTREILETIIREDCVEVTAEYHKKTGNLFKQLYRWFSYQFIRVVLFLFTFYFRKEA
ncbi:phospholipase D-like domain-containing protein [Sediminibacterium soli]|uniref:phospholipase D-like domain-containing protein n=1 Tax=Sediminibacterium soli TaxID=2698829 RepID=UPI00137A5E46|nr:phospholipase D-like domain-containing protein [Sediminibacterium soli]NCI45227.1 phospholipase [Sediminibacterium soli]